VNEAWPNSISVRYMIFQARNSEIHPEESHDPLEKKNGSQY